jgi:PAS domain S-box-containing protein
MNSVGELWLFMSQNSFGESPVEKKGKQEDNSPIGNGNQASGPDKRLMFGMIQFYEDILSALPDSFIAVFNKTGKFIEIWGNSSLNEDLGLNPLEFKSRLISDIFNTEISEQLLAGIKRVYENGRSVTLRIQSYFPKGPFWFEVKLSALQQDDNKRTVVISHFQNITKIVRTEENLKLEKSSAQVTNQLPDGVILASNKGVVNSVNESLQKLSGYDRMDFTGRKITKIPILQPKDIPRFEALLEAVFDGRLQESFEFKWANSSGKLIWSEVYASLVTRLNNVTGIQLVFKDITERKFIEKDLLKSKQAYKVIIENAHEAIFIIQDEKIKFCNARLLDLVDESLDSIINKDFLNLVYSDDKRSVEKYLSDRKSGYVHTGEITFRLIEKSGNFAWIKTKSVPIDWNKEPALLLFAHDITERKIAEQKERQHVESIEFISEKAIEFGELSEDQNIFAFIASKINEITSNTAILLVSYDNVFNQTKIEHIEGPEDTVIKLSGIIKSNLGEFSKKLNHDMIHDLSYGKLLKFNDGLFEFGYNFFPNNTFELIQETLDVGGIYLIGLTYNNNVFGTAIIFLPQGQKLGNPEAIETIAKLGSVALNRKNSWTNLRENKEKFHRIFESTEDIYFRIDIDGIIREVGPSVERILGFLPEEVTGKPINRFYVKGFNGISIIKTLLKDKRISDTDLKILKKDGSKIDASLNARTLFNEHEITVGFEGFVRDITTRKQIEQKYKESEQKFRTLADFTYDWEYWKSPLGKIIYMSPSCQRISGYSRENFVDKPELLFEITHPEDYKKFKDHVLIQEEDEKESVLKFDYRIVAKDGTTRWISHICQEVYDEKGNSLGRRVSNRDITERMNAAKELFDSEARFRTLFIESPDAVFVVNNKSVILDVNPSASELVKIEKGNLVGKSILDLVPDSERKIVSKTFSKWLTGEVTNYRGNTIRSDGKIVPIEVNGSRINYSGEKAMMCIVRDITITVNNEQRLKEIAKNAEEADKLKSAFLANVSHEIRTPMNAIVGFSEILTNQDLSKKEREEFINYITQGSNTLMNLIEDIIDITKIEAGQLKIEFSDCVVSKLLDELYATFLEIKNKNGKAGVDLRLNKPIATEDFTITSDPQRIKQILTNLLGNALKFTDEGYIEFGFDLSRKNTIEFYVRDTGVGIAKEKQELIFERFGQADNNKKNNPKGTGLGLAISQKLAGLLGGSLNVSSELGEGSVFTLSLPLSKEELIEEHPYVPLIGQEINWSKKTFLIAEDSILNYTFLEALLQRTKVKLEWAKNGKEAVEMCMKNPKIDLVLMDIKMPLLDGLEAITQIKKARKDLPIIVQTAYAMAEDRGKSMDAGADDHLTKPLHPEKLFGAIKKIFVS